MATPSFAALRRLRRWLPVMGFGAFAGLSLVMLEVDYRRGVTVLEETVVAVDNLTRAKLAVADAAMAWEASQAGDPTRDPAAQTVRLDEAVGALEDLLAGRSALVAFRGGSVLDDPALETLVAAYRERVSTVRAEAASGVSADDHVAQRLRLRGLAVAATDLERAVYRAVQERLAQKRRRHVVLLGAWGGFLALTLTGLAGLRAAGSRARLARLRAERARAAAERRYAALERLAAVGVLRVNRDGTVHDATPWWGRATGVGDGERAGKPWWTVFAPEERERGAALWQERAALGGAFSQDVRLVDGEGKRRWLAGRWQPDSLGPAGVGGWVGAFVDVTEQRALEAQLHQAQKLDAVGRLTGGVAHDFNNVLSVILTNTHLLLMDAGALGEEGREMLGDVERAAKSGRDLVKRLMGFSRRGDLELRPVDLAVAVGEAATLARKLLPAGFELEMAVPEPGPAVRADFRAIEQIILNLVSNARDAMAEGGRIRIAVDEVAADEELRGERPGVEPGRYGRITVSDGGAGMDEATLEQIFEPFFTTKKEGKGTGLGLSTVHGLMRQHGGHVRVYSEPGVGTTFRLYIPAAVVTGGRPPDGRRGPAPVGPQEGRRPSILLVDDDAALRRTTARMLVRLGYQVTEAHDGAEALRVLDAHDRLVDLILSDLSMAGMGGLELFRRLRERGDRRPFIFTSGRSERDLAGREALPGGALFLPKPWVASQLIELVGSLGLRAG